MTKLRTTLLAATFLAALPLVAQAQPVSGLYIGAGAGVNLQQTQSFYGDGENATLKARTGFVGVLSAGWGFGNGLRAEAEFGYRANRLVGKTSTIHSASDWGGRVDTLTGMLNVLFDLHISSFIVPYVGAGVGYGLRAASNLHGYHNSDRTSGTEGSFAYQGIAGAAFPISGVPGLALTVEYRYMGVLPTTFSGAEGGSVKLGNAHNHSALLGIRYAFNAAPAAVMAAPAAVAPAGKSFLVFFDWDKSTLTDRARGIIKEAAMTSKSTAHTVVEVKGYADTSGNPSYNQGISMRRAQTVAAELVRNGVAKGAIAIKAFGDTVLLVPTGPGVREPQNRRVEIIIR